MSDATLDSAALLLRHDNAIAISLTRLARAVPGEPSLDRLERRLRGDERFVLLETPALLPGLEAWTPQDLATYEPALRQLDLGDVRLVMLRDRRAGAAGRSPLAALLHQTLLELLALPGAGRFAAAAEQANAALSLVSDRPDPAARSTSPPPGPQPPGRDGRPRWRPAPAAPPIP